jgi:hypothetical protein
VIVNGYRGSDEAAMEALDRFVSELTSDSRGDARSSGRLSNSRLPTLTPE